ncbi:MAG: hypothetical protein BWZ10_03136 [candidate division BRC1 bacterium ADurb.BinA364]|nr:MAG: hypothetical protein BWZ10_03136 [candidate division BRC1 bacterium ADurb.BinA364]
MRRRAGPRAAYEVDCPGGRRRRGMEDLLCPLAGRDRLRSRPRPDAVPPGLRSADHRNRQHPAAALPRVRLDSRPADDSGRISRHGPRRAMARGGRRTHRGAPQGRYAHPGRRRARPPCRRSAGGRRDEKTRLRIRHGGQRRLHGLRRSGGGDRPLSPGDSGAVQRGGAGERSQMAHMGKRRQGPHAGDAALARRRGHGRARPLPGLAQLEASPEGLARAQGRSAGAAPAHSRAYPRCRRKRSGHACRLGRDQRGLHQSRSDGHPGARGDGRVVPSGPRGRSAGHALHQRFSNHRRRRNEQSQARLLL